MKHVVTIALGANLGDPLASLAAGLEALSRLPYVRRLTASSRVVSEPVGPPQPPYVNQLARLETDAVEPEAVLADLLQIERDQGRQRSPESRWAARVIDLDLLTFDDRALDLPGLQLPHPRIRDRSFVLAPLAELDPAGRDAGGMRWADRLALLAADPGRWSWTRPLPACDALALDAWRACGAGAGLPAPHHCDDLARVRELTGGWRRAGLTIGFVPTMGSLHEGHLSLMRVARARCDRVVASIFVNPLQFGPNEDLDSYPRDLEGDLAACARAGVDLVFTTSPEAMYPEGFSTRVIEEQLGNTLCGAARPGHFAGVTTVVTKLLTRVAPDVAIFGRKDAQQAAVIARMARDLDLPVEITTAPIVREPDGLALSSRNRYLDPTQRQLALGLVAAVRAVEAAFEAGEQGIAALTTTARAAIGEDPQVRIDYLEFVDPASFQPTAQADPGTLLALAVFVGDTRLIDNHTLGEPAP